MNQRLIAAVAVAVSGLFLADLARAAQVCGNGIIEYPEACDDGNTVDGDGCNNVCGVIPETSTLAIAGGSLAEGNVGDADVLTVNVARTGTTNFGINFGLRTVQDTASDGSDYDGFFEGRRHHLPKTAAEVQPGISLIGDFLAELDELFNVEIYGAYRTGAIVMLPNYGAAAAGDGPFRVAVADLNCDDLPDVVTGTIPGNTLGVLRNTSLPGVVSFAAVAPIATSSPYGLAVGDLDGDGNPDIVVSDHSGGALSTLRHVTAPGVADFEAKQTLTTNPGLHALVIADFDGDGKPDVAGANMQDDVVRAWRSTSTVGTIALVAETMPFPAGDGPRDLAAGDLDGDGKLDLAVTAHIDDYVMVLRNTSTAGTISFAAPVAFGTGDFPSGVALADYDGDGILDIATSNAAANTVSVLRNTSADGVLSFATHVPYAVASSSPYFLAGGDIDGDLKPDLVVSSYGSSQISVVRNTSPAPGNINFASREILATGVGPYGVAIADFDNDAQADILTGNAGNSPTTGDSITVARNNLPLVSITTASATATIENDDEPLAAFADDVETVDESAGSKTIEVTLLGVSEQTVEVSYTLGGTATQGADYTISPATLSFAPGETSKLLTVSGLADAVADGVATETIVITLQDPANAALNPPNPHTLTITNNSNPVVTPPPADDDTGGGGGGSMGLWVLWLLLPLTRRCAPTSPR